MKTHRNIVEFVVDAYHERPTLDVGNDVRCVITEFPDELVIAFPGTVSLDGWLLDFSAYPKNFGPLGYLHEGFGDGALKLWSSLREKLSTEKPLTLAGHSLGGAIAQGIGAWAGLNGFKFRLITWGTPRSAAVWNLHFIPAVKKAGSVTEYRNPGDVVPEVPPRPLWKHTVKRTNLAGEAYIDPKLNHNINLYAERTPDN